MKLFSRSKYLQKYLKSKLNQTNKDYTFENAALKDGYESSGKVHADPSPPTISDGAGTSGGAECRRPATFQKSAAQQQLWQADFLLVAQGPLEMSVRF